MVEKEKRAIDTKSLEKKDTSILLRVAESLNSTANSLKSIDKNIASKKNDSENSEEEMEELKQYRNDILKQISSPSLLKSALNNLKGNIASQSEDKSELVKNLIDVNIAGIDARVLALLATSLGGLLIDPTKKEKEDKPSDFKSLLERLLELLAIGMAALGALKELFGFSFEDNPLRGLGVILTKFFATVVVKVGKALFNLVPDLLSKFGNIPILGDMFKKGISEIGEFFVGIFTKIKGFFGFGKAAGEVAEVGTKVAAKTGIMAGAKGFLFKFLKRLPLIGTLISWYSAYKRIEDGDIVGGAIDILSGAVNLIPGAGWIISLLLDITNATMDIGKGQAAKGKVNWATKFNDWIQKNARNFPIIGGFIRMYDGMTKLIGGDVLGGIKDIAGVAPGLVGLGWVYDWLSSDKGQEKISSIGGSVKTAMSSVYNWFAKNMRNIPIIGGFVRVYDGMSKILSGDILGGIKELMGAGLGFVGLGFIYDWMNTKIESSNNTLNQEKELSIVDIMKILTDQLYETIIGWITNAGKFVLDKAKKTMAWAGGAIDSIGNFLFGDSEETPEQKDVKPNLPESSPVDIPEINSVSTPIPKEFESANYEKEASLIRQKEKEELDRKANARAIADAVERSNNKKDQQSSNNNNVVSSNTNNVTNFNNLPSSTQEHRDRIRRGIA